MITPGTAYERPGEGGYFASLNLPLGGDTGGDEGGASSAAGTVSPTSSPTTAPSAVPGGPAPRKPARATASRS